MPKHIKPVKLSYENEESYQLYRFIEDQVRVSFGHIIGLDLGAIAVVFMALGIRNLKKEIIKMKLFHQYLVKEPQSRKAQNTKKD